MIKRMLVHAQTNRYGDRIVMIPPTKPYVQLPTAGHGVRYFPQENKTLTPVFNSMRPNPGVHRNETPKKDNSYSNGYQSSKSKWEAGTHLMNVDKYFDPPIDHRKCIEHKLDLRELVKPELEPVGVEPEPEVPQPEPDMAEEAPPIEETTTANNEQEL